MKIKYAALGVAVMLAVFIGSNTAEAAPFNAENNDNIVANYPDGSHGIPGDYYLHVGSDVVKRSGNSGNFDQWYTGWSEEDGGKYIGHHTVWKVSKDGTCKEGEVFVPNASANWGDYLILGADYCAKTNDFSY